MEKPIILCVDDEPDVLRAIDRDLRKRYRDTYRVLRAASGEEAVETLVKLKARGDDVALVISDQRMPGLTGADVLAKARDLFMDARLALLTAYADTNVAIQSINEIGLDRYLSKPWDPPETHLYPELDTLLEAWASTFRSAKKGLRIIGDHWSSHSHELREFLSRNRVPYTYLDVDRDAEAAAFVDNAAGVAELPIVLLEDGTVLENPDRAMLAAKVGMNTKAADQSYDVAIVGGGPAGLAAAVYAASEGLSTVLLEEEGVGGRASTSARIDNYLGFPEGLAGASLANRANEQALRIGADLLVPQIVQRITFDNRYKLLHLADGAVISARTLVFASGMKVRRLDAPGADALIGNGVYYGAATSDMMRHAGADVHIVGGGDSAAQAALHLIRHVRSVTLVVRSAASSLAMSDRWYDQIKRHKSIHLRANTVVARAGGDDVLRELTLKNTDTDKTEFVASGALFSFIGSSPNSALLRGQVACDDKGFVLTGIDLPQVGGRVRGWSEDRDPVYLETSMPGVFAAGDVRAGSSKRVASAVGEGTIAASLAVQYLKTH